MGGHTKGVEGEKRRARRLINLDGGLPCLIIGHLNEDEALELVLELGIPSEHEEKLQPHEEDGGVEGLKQVVDQCRLALLKHSVTDKLADPPDQVQRNCQRDGFVQGDSTEMVKKAKNRSVEDASHGVHLDERPCVEYGHDICKREHLTGGLQESGSDGIRNSKVADGDEVGEPKGGRKDHRDKQNMDVLVGVVVMIGPVEREALADVEVVADAHADDSVWILKRKRLFQRERKKKQWKIFSNWRTMQCEENWVFDPHQASNDCTISCTRLTISSWLVAAWLQRYFVTNVRHEQLEGFLNILSCCSGNLQVRHLEFCSGLLDSTCAHNNIPVLKEVCLVTK